MGRDKLVALLGPKAAGSNEDPGRSDIVVVTGAADECRVPVGGQRDAPAEETLPFADIELFALLNERG